MVIGWPKRESAASQERASPWEQIEATQKNPLLPCLLVPQPAHAVLAGDLARGLLPEHFGEIPPEIHQAITMHDTGWAMIDAMQIQHLRAGTQRGSRPGVPVSFIASSPAESVQAWTASINSVESLSAAGGFIVSQHFTLLAASFEKAPARFLAAEKARRGRLATRAKAAQADLERWTGVLGFCDLLSLYLLTGLRGPVVFPLAHPASLQSAHAPRVTLGREGSLLHFTQRIFPAGFRTQLDGLKHPIEKEDSRSEKLIWEVA